MVEDIYSIRKLFFDPILLHEDDECEFLQYLIHIIGLKSLFEKMITFRMRVIDAISEDILRPNLALVDLLSNSMDKVPRSKVDNFIFDFGKALEKCSLISEFSGIDWRLLTHYIVLNGLLCVGLPPKGWIILVLLDVLNCPLHYLGQLSKRVPHDDVLEYELVRGFA